MSENGARFLVERKNGAAKSPRVAALSATLACQENTPASLLIMCNCARRKVFGIVFLSRACAPLCFWLLARRGAAAPVLVRYLLLGGSAATFPPHDNEWRNETGSLFSNHTMFMLKWAIIMWCCGMERW
jgi:hypothetical protein